MLLEDVLAYLTQFLKQKGMQICVETTYIIF